MVKDQTFASLEAIVAAYRRRPLVDDVPLTYPVNKTTVDAFVESVSLGQPLRTAIKILFDLGA